MKAVLNGQPFFSPADSADYANLETYTYSDHSLIRICAIRVIRGELNITLQFRFRVLLF
jgi:hypothetical protein